MKKSILDLRENIKKFIVDAHIGNSYTMVEVAFSEGCMRFTEGLFEYLNAIKYNKANPLVFMGEEFIWNNKRLVFDLGYKGEILQPRIFSKYDINIESIFPFLTKVLGKKEKNMASQLRGPRILGDKAHIKATDGSTLELEMDYMHLSEKTDIRNFKGREIIRFRGDSGLVTKIYEGEYSGVSFIE